MSADKGTVTGPVPGTEGSPPSDSARPDSHEPVALPVPPETRQPIAPPGDVPAPSVPVRIAPDLVELVKGIPSEAEAHTAAATQRELNEVVHRLLVVGLAVSTALMLAGLVLEVWLQRELPTVVPSIRDVFARTLQLRPSGFLSLGLLVLIFTPIMRVIGSIVAFIYERDLLFVLITCLVLIVVTLSFILGAA